MIAGGVTGASGGDVVGAVPACPGNKGMMLEAPVLPLTCNPPVLEHDGDAHAKS